MRQNVGPELESSITSRAWCAVQKSCRDSPAVTSVDRDRVIERHGIGILGDTATLWASSPLGPPVRRPCGVSLAIGCTCHCSPSTTVCITLCECPTSSIAFPTS